MTKEQETETKKQCEIVLDDLFSEAIVRAHDEFSRDFKSHAWDEGIVLVRNILTDPSDKTYRVTLYEFVKEGKRLCTFDINWYIQLNAGSRVNFAVNDTLGKHHHEKEREKEKEGMSDDEKEWLRRSRVRILDLDPLVREWLTNVREGRFGAHQTFRWPTMITYEDVPQISVCNAVTPAHTSDNPVYRSIVDFIVERDIFPRYQCDHGVVACIRPEQTKISRNHQPTPLVLKDLKSRIVESHKDVYEDVERREDDGLVPSPQEEQESRERARISYAVEEFLENMFSSERKKLYEAIDTDLVSLCGSQDLHMTRNVAYFRAGDTLPAPLVWYDFFDTDGRRMMTLDCNASIVEHARNEVWEHIQLSLSKVHARTDEERMIRDVFTLDDHIFSHCALLEQYEPWIPGSPKKHFISSDVVQSPFFKDSVVIVYDEKYVAEELPKISEVLCEEHGLGEDARILRAKRDVL